MATTAISAPLNPGDALRFPEAGETLLQAEPVAEVHVGQQTILLEETPLKTLQNRLGGIIHHAGDASESTFWLCYRGMVAQTPVLYWFTSNAEMDGENISQVAVQQNTRGVVEGCGAARPNLLMPNFDIPAFGSSQQDVLRHFKAGKIDKAGFVSYTSEHAVKGSRDCTRDQTVQYRMRNGVVSAISVSQTTSC